jgi:hypothetical protein
MYIRITEEHRRAVETLRTLLASGGLGQSADFAGKLISDADRYGQLTDKQLPWVRKLIDRANKPEREKVEIGQLSGVNALFDKARQHLKSPSIVLSIGADESGTPYLVKLSVAAAHHREPGTINVTEYDDTKEWSDLLWYGRILKDGRFEISPKVSADEVARANVDYAVDQLKEFANDPVGVATAHGRLTGRCCFCHLSLKDERSTAVGYGSTCAKSWGLAWGARPAEFAATPEAPIAPTLQVPARKPQSRRNIKLRARA